MRTTHAESKPPRTGWARKSLLFCGRCGHHSPVGGDWIAYVGVRHYRYECPNCGETVVVQPAFPEALEAAQAAPCREWSSPSSRRRATGCARPGT